MKFTFFEFMSYAFIIGLVASVSTLLSRELYDEIDLKPVVDSLTTEVELYKYKYQHCNQSLKIYGIEGCK